MGATISPSEQTNMLVNQDNADVFPLRKALKGRFDCRSFGLAVDNEEVFLRFGTGSNVL